MAGSESEQFHKAFGFARGPFAVGNGALADGYAEATEEIDTELFCRRVLNGSLVAVVEHRPHRRLNGISAVSIRSKCAVA